MLFSKQARRIVALDESSPVVSNSSGDEDYQDKSYIEKRSEELLKWKFESEIDRKLILGVIDRHVELDQEENASMLQIAINDEVNTSRK